MAEFTYNASALGAGGVIRHQYVETIVPSIGSVALAPTGGTGRTVVENYSSEPLSFKFAETRVSGGMVEGRHTTQTYVYMKDLRVFNSLKVSELRGIVTSTQAGGEDDDDNSIVMEVFYHGLWIAGQGDAIPDVDVCLKSLKRYSHLQAVIDAAEGAEGPLPEGVVLPGDPKRELPVQFDTTFADLKLHVNKRRALRGSLVKKVHDGVPGRPYDVPVPGLGKVRFGELMFKPGRRRVNLLRVALGSDTFEQGLSLNEAILAPNGGTLTIAAVEGNGTTVYP